MSEIDILVIGAGMAGASAAAALAGTARVVVLEREGAPGYHTTGRSAAVYTETYGNAAIRALTVASGRFFRAPPPGFTDVPILSDRGALLIGRADQADGIAEAYAFGRRFSPDVALLDGAAACRLVPVLDPAYVASAVHEPAARDIDVHALHQAYLRTLRRQGGRVVVDAGVAGITRRDGLWQVETAAGPFAAPVLVNAAGAWADVIAGMAGVRPVGLQPMRRTAFIFDAPAGVDPSPWTMVADVDERFYFKPDAGRLLGSLAEEAPSDPCDAFADDMDVAVAADRIEQATTLTVERVRRSWAGLRSFVADRTLVIGPAPDAEGFFWLAGQGGYGIQTAPAAAECLRALVAGEDLPADLRALGLDAAALTPDRLQRG